MGLQNVAPAVAALPLAALFLAAPAKADPLTDLVRAVEREQTKALPLRADIRAAIDGAEGKKEERAVMLLRTAPGDGNAVQTLFAFPDSGLRYLVLGEDSAYRAEGGSAKPVPLETPVDGTSWTVEDLLAFSSERCGVLRNVDWNADQMTVLCDPPKDGKAGQYALTVHRFDREKAVPVRVLYYEERQDNLVKMLRKEDFVDVGGSWRPSRMTMQNFKMRAKDVFEAKWTKSPKVPEGAFDPGKFAEVSLGDAAGSTAR